MQEKQPDINLPRIDGIEAIRHVLSKNKGIPIIIHTAYNNYKNNFMSWTTDVYIVKSSDLAELKNKIQESFTYKDRAAQIKVRA